MTPSPKSAIARGRNPRILIRSTNWIGDAVMTMPAVQRLRELEPHSHIAMLCHAKLHDLWRHNPFLSEIITFTKHPDLQEIRDRRFDVALLFPNSFRSAWEVWRAGIPCRIGFSGDCRRYLLTHVVPQTRGEHPVRKPVTVSGKIVSVQTCPAPRHQTHHYLDLISYLGGRRDFCPPRIHFAYEDLPHLAKFFHEDGRPLLGINAGAEFGPAKRWPPTRFAETAYQIHATHDCRWLIFGCAADTPIASMIENELRQKGIPPGDIINLAGKTSLLELCALLKVCRLLITNDTGPMHIAYALGTPLVAIFGSTSSELTGPLGPNCMVIREPVECSPCFLRECPIDFRCMNAVTVQRVTEAALSLLRKNNTNA
jgi:heptosyltransferase-2